MHAVLRHIGDGLAGRRAPVQRVGVLEQPVALVAGAELLFGDGADLTPRTFAQHARLLPLRLRQSHGGSRLARTHIRRDEITVEQLLLRYQPTANAVGLLAPRGRKSPRPVRHRHVVLRIQRVIALLAGADNHIRLGLAMADHIQI